MSAPRPPAQRGAALLVVLWLLALLTVLVGGFALVSRTEALQGRAMRGGTQAQFAARAGIDYAMLRLQDPLDVRRWSPDGRTYRLAFDDARLEIRIVDESGKVDLNTAEPELLARLFLALEVDEDDAYALAQAIAEWRDTAGLSRWAAAGGRPGDGGYVLDGPRHAPFESVGELQLVDGVTPEIHRAAAPHLTVHTGLALPSPDFAQEPVLRALGLDDLQREERLAAREDPEQAPGVAVFGTGTYSIDSTATLGDGSTALVSATVRAGSGLGGRIYQPLSWRLGEVF